MRPLPFYALLGLVHKQCGACGFLSAETPRSCDLVKAVILQENGKLWGCSGVSEIVKAEDGFV